LTFDSELYGTKIGFELIIENKVILRIATVGEKVSDPRTPIIKIVSSCYFRTKELAYDLKNYDLRPIPTLTTFFVNLRSKGVSK
jgi:hypothetical protein